ALASHDAWIKYYRQDENSGNSSVSYYNKGALLAMLMDVKILAETNGRYRLDDVLRAAYQEFYLEKERGFEESEFEELIERVTGVSVSEIFRMAHTVERIDYNHYLNAVGYQMVDYAASLSLPDLGAVTSLDNGRVMVQSIIRGSTAWEGGLSVRDEILAIDGERIDVAGRDLTTLIQQYKIGDTINLLISRDGLIRELPVELKKDTQGQFVVTRLRDASAEQRRLGDQWLSLETKN